MKNFLYFLYFLYFFLLLFTFTSAQEIQKEAQEKMASLSLLNRSEKPEYLQYLQRLNYVLDGSPVIAFPIRSHRRDRGLEVEGFYNRTHSLYWVHAEGAFLNMDLWYGPLALRTEIEGFKEGLEAGTIRLPFPTPTPQQLERFSGYESTDPVNNPVQTYILQAPPSEVLDGITIIAYYFPRMNVFWIHKQGGIAGFNDWYGPFSLGQASPNRLELVATVSTATCQHPVLAEIEIKVHNHSRRDQTLRFSSSLQGDYEIDSRYRYSSNRFFTMAFTQVHVPAGSSAVLLRYAHTSRDYPLAAGEHRLTAFAQTANLGLIQSEPVSFFVGGPIDPHFDRDKEMQQASDLLRKQRYAEAIILLNHILSRFPRYANAHYNLACAYALSNQIDRALDALENAFRSGFRDFAHAWVDSDLNNLHNHPRFNALIREYKNR
jgi:tetratricopeptide (TPR) repeat protein